MVADLERRRRSAGRFDAAGRVAEAILGLWSIGLAIVVLANPRISFDALVLLVAFVAAFAGVREFIIGGARLGILWTYARELPTPARTIRAGALVILGAVTLLLVAIVLTNRGLDLATLVLLLAAAVVAQGFGRIVTGAGREMPAWLRRASVATGALTVAVVLVAVLLPGLALLTVTILLAVVLLLNGIESVVSGLRPTDPRQFVLLKLLLFSALYGLVLINWIDLFGKSVPGYGIWLLLTYMAPFGVLVVFDGLSDWPLAVSLGLLVSLMNDLGYFFVGDLLFGFHVHLLPWLEGQLGLLGDRVVTIFRGGFFRIRVTSIMMGASIYLRALVVGAILYYWWRHPGRFVSRIGTPSGTRAVAGPSGAPPGPGREPRVVAEGSVGPGRG